MDLNLQAKFGPFDGRKRRRVVYTMRASERARDSCHCL